MSGSMNAHERVSSIYQVIDGFRRLPSVYVGQAFDRDPFHALQAFLSGLSFTDLDAGVPDFWNFQRWITARTDAPPAAGTYWLFQQYGSDEGYQNYFRYLDEYRTCREMEVGTVRREFIAPKFRVGKSAEEMSVPPIPDKLYIGQFAPSSVYFVAAVYDGRLEYDFPYFSTIEAAMYGAERWGVPVSEWRHDSTS